MFSIIRSLFESDNTKKLRLWNNTIVIFTSDNGGVNRGGGYNFPYRGEKY